MSTTFDETTFIQGLKSNGTLMPYTLYGIPFGLFKQYAGDGIITRADFDFLVNLFNEAKAQVERTVTITEIKQSVCESGDEDAAQQFEVEFAAELKAYYDATDMFGRLNQLVGFFTSYWKDLKA
jgi:hypothetical protein